MHESLRLSLPLELQLHEAHYGPYSVLWLDPTRLEITLL